MADEGGKPIVNGEGGGGGIQVESFDTFILGAGMAGLGVASELVELGKTVVVMEKNDPFAKDANRFNPHYGASFQNAGMLNFIQPTNSITNHWSKRTLKGFKRHNVEFEQNGAYTVADTKIAINLIDAAVPEHAIKGDKLNELKDKEPNLKYGSISGVLRYAEAGSANPEDTVQTLVKSLSDAGVSFRYGGEILSIKRGAKESSNKWIVATIKGQVSSRFEVNRIVVAAGPASKEILRKYFTLSTPITKVLGLMMETDPINGDENSKYFTAPILGAQSAVSWGLTRLTCGLFGSRKLDTTVDPRDNKPWTTHLYLNVQKGRIYIGGPRITIKDTYTLDDISPSNPKYQDDLKATLKYANELVNLPKDFEFKRSWGGVMAFGSDGHAIVGPISGIDNLYVCTGFASFGFQKGFGAGMWLANLMENNNEPKMDDSYEDLGDQHAFKSVLPGKRVTKVSFLGKMMGY